MGKTLVLRAFRELGAYTIDADSVVRELLEQRPVVEKLKALMGPEVVDSGGRLLRDRMADAIFEDEAMRIAVEDVLHPLVFEKIEERLKGVDADVVVVEAVVIFERGHEGRFDKVITVYTDELTALQRLEAAGVEKEEAIRRLASQMPVQEKLQRSDFSIDNSGTPEATRKRVEKVYKALLEITRAANED